MATATDASTSGRPSAGASRPRGPTAFERLCAAGGASVMAALVVNPLDIIKTRMQAQAAAINSRPSAGSGSLFERWTTASSPGTCVRTGVIVPTHICSHECLRPLSMSETLQKIVRTEGAPVLWRGVHTSLMMSVPMVGIYMPLYDYLYLDMAPKLGFYAPFAAGALARTAAVFAVAPLEFIRTRVQAAHSAAAAALPSGRVTALSTIKDLHTSSHALAKATPARRVLATVPKLWTGFAATLARDVPFSGLYWFMLEPIRAALLAAPLPSAAAAATTTSATATFRVDRATSHSAAAAAAAASDTAIRGDVAAVASSVAEEGAGVVHQQTAAAGVSQQRLVAANVIAGAVSGGLAAAITTPFDVVKTRQQLAVHGSAGGHKLGLAATLQDIYQAEGPRGLFTGLGPRAARAAPACAIVVAMYEWLKAALH